MRRFVYKTEEVPFIFASVTCVAAWQRRDGARWLQQEVPSLGVCERYLLFTRARRNKRIGALCDDTGLWHWDTYFPPSLDGLGGDLDAPVVPLHDHKARAETHHITAT